MQKRTVHRWCALAACYALMSPLSQARAQQLSPADTTPKIAGFEVIPLAKALPGGKLAFTLRGSPGGTAIVKIYGATGDVALAETGPGVYEGSYTLRKQDKVTVESTATGSLRVDNSAVSVPLREPLVGKISARAPAPAAKLTRD